MASSIPTARTNLHAGLVALTATGQPLEGVGVYRTGRWTEDQAHDRITLLNARNITRTPAALSPQTPIREEYTLELAVEVFRSGDGIATVETRLWAVITEIEKYVLANKTLGGAVNQALPSGADEQSGPSQADEDTVLAMATVRLSCWARVLLN